MLGKICRLLAFAVLLLVTMYSVSLAQNCESSLGELKKQYYSNWIGVQAPDLGPNFIDRNNGPQIKIASYKGKRVLLYSFDTGNFVNGPGKEEQDAIFQLLYKAIDLRNEVGREKFEVIGFTKGFGMFFQLPEDQIPEEEKNNVKRWKEIPLVNCNNRNFPEPYSILESPGGIIIDRKGIIQEIIPRTMTEAEIRKAATAPDWDKPVNPAPIDDPWEGRGEPKPLLQAKLVWSKNIPYTIGMTSADFNLDGVNKLLAVNTNGKMLVISPEGNIETEISIPGISGRLPVAIHWAELEKGKIGFTTFEGGWPDEVFVFDKGGNVIWKYPSSDKHGTGIDSVGFVNIDNDRTTELLMGFNAKGDQGALHLISSQGQVIWRSSEVSNVWDVVGIPKHGSRPGMILSTGRCGDIAIFDSSGKYIRTIPSDCNYVDKFSAADIDSKGSVQVVSFWKAHFGKSDYAVATDLEGNLFWKYPIVSHDVKAVPQPIIAVDINEDGVKEWIIKTRRGELVVLNKSGKLIAKFNDPIKNWSSYAVLPRKGKTALFIFGGKEEMVAYELEPIK
jgi:hypothetical protein